jgi:hypothetical protein
MVNLPVPAMLLSQYMHRLFPLPPAPPPLPPLLPQLLLLLLPLALGSPHAQAVIWLRIGVRVLAMQSSLPCQL